jgi:prepilin-type N-terminal cleavage/methylation domain-containing protein
MICSDKQRGDTLVEVLFSIAIIGLFIGGAYAISNRNIQLGRQAREQIEALRFAEGQVEKIKHLISINDTSVSQTAPNNVFCIPSTTKVNSPNPSCTQGLYTARITYNDTGSPSTAYFDVQVTWIREGVSASGELGSVRLTYRMR